MKTFALCLLLSLTSALVFAQTESVQNFAAENSASREEIASTQQSSMINPDPVFHFRTGFMTSHFNLSSAQTMSESSFTNFATDIDLFTSASSATSILFDISYDSKYSDLSYMHVGVGRRYYLGSEYKATSTHWKPYVGGDFGLANQTFLRRGTIASYTTAILYFGAGGGLVYQFNPEFGLDLNLRAARGLSIGGFAVNTVIGQAMVGVTKKF